jgi:hypothetical protein
MPPRRAAVPTRKFLKPKVLKSSSGRSFQSEQFIQNFWQLTKSFWRIPIATVM